MAIIIPDAPDSSHLSFPHRLCETFLRVKSAQATYRETPRAGRTVDHLLVADSAGLYAT